MRKIAFLSIFIFLVCVSSVIFTVFAQEEGLSGVASNLVIADTEAGPGDILCSGQDGVVRCTQAYDKTMIGVLVENPVLAVGQKVSGTKAVISSGRALVTVSATASAIEVGDFITSSTRAGVGQKADASGYVLGRVLSAYSDTTVNGIIEVDVQISQVGQSGNVRGLLGSLLNLLSTGFGNPENFPLILRYIAAAIVASVTFIIAFFSFVRFIRSGLEAIGRNPLARRTIFAGMLVNASIVSLLTIAGFGIALAIIVL